MKFHLEHPGRHWEVIHCVVEADTSEQAVSLLVGCLIPLRGGTTVVLERMDGAEELWHVTVPGVAEFDVICTQMWRRV